ncbi:Hypothetical_protein [Hexamita inflata]|uniref:Hypothetical_protein n=1 Tax=Hexamita inflata TaxID=28002 RepID=A0AA86TWT2_9EUKA|nr:Hypothetical protein HINF_LOCUS11853 [Hexamita inflata]
MYSIIFQFCNYNFQVRFFIPLYNICIQQYRKKSVWNLQCNKTQTQILCSQYIAEVLLSRVNAPEQEETDQRVMTLFPALNLEALRVVANTRAPRFLPTIIYYIMKFCKYVPKIVTKITSDVNNVSSSAELTQVV